MCFRCDRASHCTHHCHGSLARARTHALDYSYVFPSFNAHTVQHQYHCLQIRPLDGDSKRGMATSSDTSIGASAVTAFFANLLALLATAPTATTAIPSGFTLDQKTSSLKIPTQIYFGPFEASGRALVVEKNKGILITCVSPTIELLIKA